MGMEVQANSAAMMGKKNMLARNLTKETAVTTNSSFERWRQGKVPIESKRTKLGKTTGWTPVK
jgi:hypothetical protein